MEELDYRDVKVEFKVTEPNTSDRIVINQAQISKETDKEGNDVKDRDSTADKWIDGEDDQDTAPIMLTIKTGATTVYAGVIIAVISILGLGIYSIKKYVLK